LVEHAPDLVFGPTVADDTQPKIGASFADTTECLQDLAEALAQHQASDAEQLEPRAVSAGQRGLRRQRGAVRDDHAALVVHVRQRQVLQAVEDDEAVGALGNEGEHLRQMTHVAPHRGLDARRVRRIDEHHRGNTQKARNAERHQTRWNREHREQQVVLFGAGPGRHLRQAEAEVTQVLEQRGIRHRAARGRKADHAKAGGGLERRLVAPDASRQDVHPITEPGELFGHLLGEDRAAREDRIVLVRQDREAARHRGVLH
jgi:hypothetical protein